MLELYTNISRVLAWIVGVAVFLGSWVYCADTYGFLLGFGLGWLPASIAATLAAVGTLILWPVVGAVAIWLATS